MPIDAHLWTQASLTCGHLLPMAWLDEDHSASQELPCSFKTRSETWRENPEPWQLQTGK